jgi:acetyl esterase
MTMDYFKAAYLPSPDDESDWRASPLKSAHPNFSGLPPAFVAVASHDPLCSEGLAYASALKAASVETTQRVYAGVHIFWMLAAGLGEEESASFISDLASAVVRAFEGGRMSSL